MQIEDTVLRAIEECCACRYWTGLEGSDSDCGRCRRYPPTKHVSMETSGDAIKLSVKQGFPETFRASWCGEFAKVEKV